MREIFRDSISGFVEVVVVVGVISPAHRLVAPAVVAVGAVVDHLVDLLRFAAESA